MFKTNESFWEFLCQRFQHFTHDQYKLKGSSLHNSTATTTTLRSCRVQTVRNSLVVWRSERQSKEKKSQKRFQLSLCLFETLHSTYLFAATKLYLHLNDKCGIPLPKQNRISYSCLFASNHSSNFPFPLPCHFFWKSVSTSQVNYFILKHDSKRTVIHHHLCPFPHIPVLVCLCLSRFIKHVCINYKHFLWMSCTFKEYTDYAICVLTPFMSKKA